MMPKNMHRLGAGCLLLLAAGGCRAVTTSYIYPDDLTHPDYVKRSKAVRQFAAERDVSQLPAAFDLLNDEDGQIRAMAYLTIREMSRDAIDWGYLPYLDAKTRRETVRRWRGWWVGGQKPRTLEEPQNLDSPVEAAGG